MGAHRNPLAVVASKLGRRPFAQQLALLVVATAAPLILASSLMTYSLVANERARIRESVVVSAKSLAALVDNEIDTHMAMAFTLAHSPTLIAGDLATFRQEALGSSQFLPGTWVSVSRPDGQIVLNTQLPEDAPLPTKVRPDLVQRGFATQAPQLGDLVVGPVSKRWVAFVEMPVFRDGAPLYSLSIGIRTSRFLQLIESQFPSGQVVGIVDSQFRFVARVPDYEARVGALATPGFREAIAKTPQGWTESKSLEGNWTTTGFATTRHGWSVGVGQLETEIQQPLFRILGTTFGITIVLLLLSGALAWVITRHNNRGMIALADAADDLGEGRSLRTVDPPFTEADRIAKAMSEAANKIARRDQLLGEANATLEAKVAERTAELSAEIERREKTEATLRQAQKMEAVGQLTGGIAHDFNNVLTIILGNLDTIQRRLPSVASTNIAALIRPLEQALQGARNAAKLTHRLLAFSRQQALEPTPVNLNSLINGMSDLLTRTVGETIKTESVTAAGLWTAFADTAQVENSLLNLVINARDAMPNGGKLTIETANVYLDDAYTAAFDDLKSGQYVVLTVSDTGTGIPKDVLEKVFEPFFTTKEAGKGTGLGLAMVHGFAKQSRGHVRIYSEVGQGTAVKLYLPRYIANEMAAAPAAIIQESVSPRAINGETILLVEDDHAVRTYATEALQNLGYAVLAAADGDEALAIFATATRIDLLFTDVVLGGRLNGRELAENLWTQRAQLAVLFTTGYTRNAIVHEGRLDPGLNLLNKPYVERELAIKVRNVIDTAKDASVAKSTTNGTHSRS